MYVYTTMSSATPREPLASDFPLVCLSPLSNYSFANSTDNSLSMGSVYTSCLMISLSFLFNCGYLLYDYEKLALNRLISIRIIYLVLAETCNVLLYALWSASFVVWVGMLSFIMSFCLACILGRMTYRYLFGTMVSYLGTVIVMHFANPYFEHVLQISRQPERMFDYGCSIRNPGLLGYVCLVLTICVVLKYFVCPLWDRPARPEDPFWVPLIPITIASSTGSLKVCLSIGFGIALKRTFASDPTDVYPWKFWLTSYSFFALLIALSIEIYFLKQALSKYKVTTVFPIYYTILMSLSSISTSFFYKLGDVSKNSFGTMEIMCILFGFLFATVGYFETLTAASKQNEDPESNQNERQRLAATS